MADRALASRRLQLPSLRKAVTTHPITSFLLVLYSLTVGLALIPALTVPKPLPNDGHLYGVLSSALGCAGAAFVVSAAAGGRDAVRDLARRCLRWRVGLRWYAVALLGLPAVTLLVDTALYGTAPMHALSENWPLLLSSYLPTLALMIVLYNLTEECGFTGFLFARLQDQHGPLRAAVLTTICFWLFHLPTFVIDTGSWALAAIAMGFVLLPHLASRLIVGWLYNASGASVLIAGLFHATFNSTINPGGFAVAVLDLPREEAFVLLMGIAVVAGAVVAVTTRGRLGLPSQRAEQSAVPLYD
jgi:membrane protease YdiL (CAAX protease family)